MTRRHLFILYFKSAQISYQDTFVHSSIDFIVHSSILVSKRPTNLSLQDISTAQWLDLSLMKLAS